MTEQYPITPPTELVMQWVSLACEHEGNESWVDLATQAARWGADQELEAFVEWMKIHLHSGPNLSKQLRAAFRPNPPSLKEQALEALTKIEDNTGATYLDSTIIRRALERLHD